MTGPQTNSTASPFEALLTFPARRPVATLVIAGVLLAVAAIGLAFIRIDTSLKTMFPRGKPSADAMVSVLEGFPASNELILLASSAEPAPDKLLSFARRFEKGITESADAKGLIGGVAYRPDPSFVEFAQSVVVPAGLYYLDEPAYAEARRRLTPEGMREQLQRTAADLAAPGAAGALAKAKADDPLRLYEFFLARLAGRQQFKTLDGGMPQAPKRGGSGATQPARPELPPFISPDGRAILIRIVGTRPPSDLDYCEQLVKAVTAGANGANTDGLTLDYTGAYAAADFSHHAIRSDSIESILVSIFLLQALFLVVYRRPFRQFLLEISPVVIGVFAGFCIYGWTRGGLSPVAAVIGGILAGMGIDYSVLYLAAYFRHLAAGKSPIEAVRETSVRTVGAIFAAWFTSAIGFIAIAWSSVPTLRDFALLGTMGLAGTFLAVVFVLPAVVTLWDTRRLAKHDSPAARRMPFRWDVRPMLGVIHRHRIPFMATASIVFVAALMLAFTRPGGPLPLETNLHVMHPQPNPALAAERVIAERFGSEPGALIVYLKATTPEKLVELSYEVERRLSQAPVRSAGVAGTFGLASLLPDPTITRNRKPLSEAEADKVVADFNAALGESDLSPERYTAYPVFLRQALTMRRASDGGQAPGVALPPPSVESLGAYPELWRSLLPSQAASGGQPPTEAITLVFIDRPTGERAAREAMVSAARQALDGVDGATLTGLPVISRDAEEATSQDLPRLLAIAGVLVMLVLLAYYRSLWRTALAMLPLVFSLTVLAAVARLADINLNLVNLVALPLLIGIDVDYGIYLVSMAARRRRSAINVNPGDQDVAAVVPVSTRMAASAQAVITCAIASTLGFGSLAWVSVPAVRSLGIVVAVGVLASLFGTFALRAPLLMKDEEDAAKSDG